MSVPIILDTDTGSDIDDVYAFVLAMKHPEIELVGVTTVGSFPHARERVAARFLRLGGRDAFTCIKPSSIPVESHGMFTPGMTVCEP